MTYFLSLLLFFATEYAPLKPKKRDNKEDMADALFLAQKKRGQRDDDDEYDETTTGGDDYQAPRVSIFLLQ